MIHGSGEHLTDGQWLALMRLVPDGAEIDLTLPARPGADAVLHRLGRRYVVHPDGTHTEVFEVMAAV